MSERGQCWDNASAASFWAMMKCETLPSTGCFRSRLVAQETLQNRIVLFQ